MNSDAISLLELEPDLGALVPEARRRRASSDLVVRTFARPRGKWQVPPARASSGALGILVLGGVLMREVVVERTTSAELLGEGDLIRPWGLESAGDATWTALAPVRLAFLDEPFVARLAAYPELVVGLTRRLDDRANRLAEAKAISQVTGMERRVLALFSHLSARWGRVTPDGTAVTIALSHSTIGHLLGARRPTVTTAISALAARDALIRRRDGTWLLPRVPGERRFERTAEPDLETLLSSR